MDSHGRVAVIGAGIVGLTTALALTQRGFSVTVVEKTAPGAGASKGANGALTPYSDHGADPAIVAAAIKSQGLYPEHLAFLYQIAGLHVDNDQNGVIEVAFDEVGYADLEQTYNTGRVKGWPVEWLDRDSVVSTERALSKEALAGLLYTSESSIDVIQLLDATLKALKSTRATISCPTRAIDVRPSTADTVVVTTTSGSFEVDAAVICTGTGRLSIDGASLPRMRRIRGEILETWGPPAGLKSCLYWRDAFLTPRRDGRVLVGTTYVEQTGDMDEDIATVSVQGALTQLADAVTVMPSLRNYELRRVWKDWRPALADDLPILGRMGTGNIFGALGFSGLGYTLAPYAADAIVSMILGSSEGLESAFFADRKSLVGSQR